MPRWSLEARAKQAAKVKGHVGKAVCSKNSTRHGAYSRDLNELLERVNTYAEFLEWKRRQQAKTAHRKAAC